MKRFTLLLITVLLFAFASPAFAQDGLTVTIPDGTFVSDTVVVGGLFIVSVLLALLGGMGYALYKSAPQWVQTLLQAALEAGVKQIDTYVDTSPSKVDDVLWMERVRKEFEKRGLVMPRFEEKNPTMPQSPSSNDTAVG